MIPYSIAVEPPYGWSGIKPAQSKIGFQWLYVQDQKLGGNRIKHTATVPLALIGGFFINLENQSDKPLFWHLE